MTHSSTLAWIIPWTEEPGRLQSMGLLRVGHDWATSLSLFPFMHWRRTRHPLQCSCLESPRAGGAWWAAVYGVTQSQPRLKRLSSSSKSSHSLLPSTVLNIIIHFNLCQSHVKYLSFNLYFIMQGQKFHVFIFFAHFSFRVIAIFILSHYEIF